MQMQYFNLAFQNFNLIKQSSVKILQIYDTFMDIHLRNTSMRSFSCIIAQLYYIAC